MAPTSTVTPTRRVVTKQPPAIVAANSRSRRFSY
jgi:hypothetical protein